MIKQDKKLARNKTLNSFMQTFDPEKLSLQEMLAELIELKHHKNNDIFIELLAEYLPSSKQNTESDETLLYLLNVPKDIRQQDKAILTECLRITMQYVHDKKISFNHPLTTLIMEFCIAYSGINDSYGIGLDLVFNDVEAKIGHLPIEDLAIYDEENSQVTIAFFEITRLFLTFFNLDLYNKFLLELTTKEGISFNFDQLGDTHGDFLHSLLIMPIAKRYIAISKFLIDKKIDTKIHPLKLSIHTPDIPDYAAEYYGIDDMEEVA